MVRVNYSTGNTGGLVSDCGVERDGFAWLDRAARSPRIQRRAERELGLEAQVALLRHRRDQLEMRLTAYEHRPPGNVLGLGTRVE